jgi:leader peptidase (prepilin peptidase) / N-methyltransferase
MEAIKVDPVVYIIIVILGLITGSFLNVCISRIPEEESIVYPPSHCPKCRIKLGFLDLIPLLSYLMLRGRCRYCGEKISVRYPVVEALTAALFLMIYLKSGLSVQFAYLLIFSVLLILISFIDLEHLVIPDFLMLIGIGTGLAYSLYSGGILESLTGACFGFLFMFLLSSAAKYALKKEAMGDGDIKLLVMLGANLGVERTILSVVCASLAGAAVGLLLIALKILKREDYIPFAPFLALGAVLAILIYGAM